MSDPAPGPTGRPPHRPRFRVEVDQNPYLPQGGTEMHAILTVSAVGAAYGAGAGGAVPRPRGGGAVECAVVLVVDCSSSMDYPPEKIRHAREATAAAVDALRDGTRFALVAGSHRADQIFPAPGRLAVAGPESRAAAKEALRRLVPGGGTAIGSWLRLADQLLGASGAEVRHAVLLTDGRNEHEEPGELRAALEACAGRFTCDARGVGTDWEVAELTGVAEALLGTADIVADPAGLAADFRRMMAGVMEKEVADVALRVWTPQGATVTGLKQVAPTLADLTGRRTESAPRSGDYPTGSWGNESRDYHLTVRVPAAPVGREMLAARVTLVLADGSPVAVDESGPERPGLVRAVWTDDRPASTAVSPRVGHYSRQAELTHAIRQGLAARRAGQVDEATAKLGRAVQLAAVSGNEDTAKLLAKVVDVLDAGTGTVRLKPRVADADEMTLETRSIKTVRVKK
jgi:hypothetical protein